jgi:hypothetical protein
VAPPAALGFLFEARGAVNKNALRGLTRCGGNIPIHSEKGGITEEEAAAPGIALAQVAFLTSSALVNGRR